MAAAKSSPGNANLPIGAAQTAILENGAPGKSLPHPAWHSRGYLPHFDSPDATQHVTFHLADSLPHAILQRLEAQLKKLPTETRAAERRKRLDAWIDAGHGSCVLRKPHIAGMVQESLLAFDSLRYRLLAWVVMPNHVHVLFVPTHGWTVAKIVAAWKKFTARRICDERRNSGKGLGAPVWHREYWDRYIRDQKHFEQTVRYIQMNPVKAGLAATADRWPWSSAHLGTAVPGNANLPIGVRKP